MAWASARCKSQAHLGAPLRFTSLLSAAQRLPTPRNSTGAPQPEPRPTPAHSLRLSGGLMPAICATPRIADQRAAAPRIAIQRGLRPTHITRCRRTSRAGANSATPRSAARCCAPPRIAPQPNGGGQPPHTPPLSLWLSGGLIPVHQPPRHATPPDAAHHRSTFRYASLRNSPHREPFGAPHQ
jgi:hypothetical protein